MKNMKSTKRALLVSVMSLFVCFTMLIGTTYAWFTDSVTSAGNIIKTGTLDVKLEYKAPTDADWNDASEGPIFEYDNWEPGYVMVRNVKVSNVGSLDLKYVLTIVPNQEVETETDAATGESHKLAADLADVIEAYMFETTETYTRDDLVTTSDNYVGTVADLIADADGAAYGTLDAQTSVEYVIVLKMSDNAGNEYQDLSLGGGFSVHLLASQLASEEDDLGDNTYDEDATFGISGAGSATVDGSAAYNVPAINGNKEGPVNVGYMEITDAAIDPDAEAVSIVITQTGLQSNITVADDETAKTYDVTVSGLKAGNTEPVKVGIYVEKDRDPASFKVYHTEGGVNTEIACTYNPYTGYVIFESASFSPFTVVYDAESEYVPPVAGPEDLPVANVVNSTDYENVDLPWESYGQWSPTEGLDSQLEAAYTFTCVDTLEDAKASPYAEWECDFYVMLDKDLGANQIFLGGNYGEFGWVGFHNGDLTLAANTEIPLIGSFAGAWTYAQVVQNVGTFICGVGDVGDALSGATFTVMLRLTNPKDATEYYNVATINYTFK